LRLHLAKHELHAFQTGGEEVFLLVLDEPPLLSLSLKMLNSLPVLFDIVLIDVNYIVLVNFYSASHCNFGWKGS
jgi:hypothetical protein